MSTLLSCLLNLTKYTRYFDFGKEELYAGLEWGAETKIAVFEAFYYFLDHESVDIQNATLQAIGSICIRHYDFMMDDRLKLRYITILTKGVSSTQTTTQVRINSAPKNLRSRLLCFA